MSTVNDKDLANVNGGTTEYEDLKRDEFETAWVELKLKTTDSSRPKMDELFLRWQKVGYKPDAKTFLKKCKI